MDHTVRLWNPYVPSKPVAQLMVHTTSILDVVIAKDAGLIFSYSQDSVSLIGVLMQGRGKLTAGEHSSLSCDYVLEHSIKNYDKNRLMNVFSTICTSGKGM